MNRVIHLPVLVLIGAGLFCNSVHAALVLDDTLQGSTTGTRSGGSFVAGGWQVTGGTNSIYWHIPTVSHGAAEFDVRGLNPNEGGAGMGDKTELFHMYDYTFGNSDTAYNGGYRDNPYKHFIRKTGILDTARVNSMEIVWAILTNYEEPDTPQVSWNPATTYRFREEWGPDGAGNSELRLYRDGVRLLTTSVPGTYSPAGHSVRIAASTRRAADFGAPIGAVFSNVKVWDLSTANLAVTQPANGAAVNTTVAFVQWTGVTRTRYQVRVTKANDPDSAIAWDSGEVVSNRNYAWTGPLPDQTTYNLFVRIGDTTAWSPWSAGAQTFRVDTTSAVTGANVVRVNGNSLRDNNGAFLGLGATYMQALRRAKFDRARLNADLAVLASRGFNYVRILSMVNWNGLEIAPVSFTNSAGVAVTGWTDYAQQFRDMIDIIAQHGMRAEVTVFADAQYVMPSKAARLAHLNLILANIAGREDKIVHLEVANEAWQNGFPGSTGIADLREFAQVLANGTSVPVAITSNDDLSDAGITSLNAGSAADLATVHFSRDTGTIEGGWLPVRECYRAGNLPGVPPVTSNEPIGPGSSVSTENDPIKLCSAAVFAWIANLPAYVYHTRAGVFGWVNCCPPSGSESRFENMAGVDSYKYLRTILPADLASWVRNDGLEATAPFTVFCNGTANTYWPTVTSPTSGCDRNIGSAKGREFVCFPMGILGGGVTLQARRPVKFHVFNPLTGAVVSTHTLNAAQSVTLPQGPGAYILKGSFRDVNTPLVPKGANWKYLDNGSDQGIAWRDPAFNDGTWSSGPAQLGFGDGDEATIVNGGPAAARFPTTYFRRAFPVSDASAFTGLSLRVLRDDGAIVYLNGEELLPRLNMTGGAVNYLTPANSSVPAADETTTFYPVNLTPDQLDNGANVLAVEIHQAGANSTDLSFDLELSGIGNLPPVVNISSPVNAATLAAPATVAVNALALDSDGTISKVEFFVGGVKVSEDTTAPFSHQLTNLSGGTYALSVVATDDAGAVTSSATNNISVRELLVAAGSTWKYLDTGANPGASWMQSDFPDTAWPGGPALLGFGDLNGQLPVTSINATSSRITTYFRRSFTVANPRQSGDLTLSLLRDDGAVIWLNGAEVHRSNMPAAPALIAASTQASTQVGLVPADENRFFTATLDARKLRVGANVIAAEVHQFGTGSTDLGFDLSLSAAADIPGVLIPAGATWKFRDTGIVPPGAWTSNTYDDLAWTSGPARLGYGDTQATLISDGGNPASRHVTTWFRHRFTVANAALFDALRLELQRDDGAIVYLNGVEVLRDNLSSSGITPSTLATTAVAGEEETAWNLFTLPSTALVTGANTLAVELHQFAPDSNDLGLDVRLFGLRQSALTFTDWQAAQFGSDKSNGVVAGELADFDNDRLVTLVEYALATDPRNASQTAPPTLDTATGRPALRFTRNSLATDLTVTVQASDVLTGPWTNLARSMNGNPFDVITAGTTIIESSSGATRSVEVRDLYLLTNPAHPHRFMRLHISIL